MIFSEDLLEGATISTGHSSGNNNPLNYIFVKGSSGRTYVGSIVNIAAHFNLGLEGIDVDAVASHHFGTHNKHKFGAGTVRKFINLPLNHYSGDYDDDIEQLMRDAGLSSFDEFMEKVNEADKHPDVPKKSFVPKIRYPCQNITGLLFDSARIVLIGASNEYNARHGASLIVYMLCKYMKIPAKLTDFRVVNIVATFSVGFEVDLYALAEGEGSMAEFDPHLFGAVILRSLSSKTALLVNKTGNCIVTGSDSRKQIALFFEEKFEIIAKYRKVDPEAFSILKPAKRKGEKISLPKPPSFSEIAASNARDETKNPKDLSQLTGGFEIEEEDRRLRLFGHGLEPASGMSIGNRELAITDSGEEKQLCLRLEAMGEIFDNIVKESREEGGGVELISKRFGSEANRSVGRSLAESSEHVLHPTEQRSNRKKAALQLGALVDSLKGMEAIKAGQREEDFIKTKRSKRV